MEKDIKMVTSMSLYATSMSLYATLTSVDGVKIFKGSDFDDYTGKLNKPMDLQSLLVFNTN